jgi:type I restriction enzyme, S subunit
MVVRPVGAVLDLSFIKHGLLGGFSIQSAITGSAQPQITRTSLNGIVVPTPPMDRQLEIVRLLDNCQLTLENLSTSLSQMKTRFQELQNSILKEILGGSNA